jgi:predicted ATPase
MEAAVTTLLLGSLPRARRHFDKVIEHYRNVPEAEAKRLAYEIGVDPGQTSYVHAAWCMWLLGHPDRALQLANEALAIAARVPHDYTHSRGLYWNSVLHVFRREWPTVRERAAAAIASAEEHGYAMAVPSGRIMQGAARAILEPPDGSVAEIREALAAYRATGARYHGTLHLVLLAQALAACGRQGEGLSVLAEAAALAEETGERYVEAEIHRLRANLLLTNGDHGSAVEAHYVKALEVARVQEARSLELRAACDLARLWAERGERRGAVDPFTAGSPKGSIHQTSKTQNRCWTS